MASTPRWRISFAMFLVALLAGCSTIVPHDRISDDQSKVLGSFYAVARGCHEVGGYSDREKDQYQQVIEGFLDVSVYDKAAFSAGIEEVLRDFSRHSHESIKTSCSQHKDEMAKVFTALSQRHILIKHARTNRLAKFIHGIGNLPL